MPRKRVTWWVRNDGQGDPQRDKPKNPSLFSSFYKKREAELFGAEKALGVAGATRQQIDSVRGEPKLLYKMGMHARAATRTHRKFDFEAHIDNAKRQVAKSEESRGLIQKYNKYRKAITRQYEKPNSDKIILALVNEAAGLFGEDIANQIRQGGELDYHRKLKKQGERELANAQTPEEKDAAQQKIDAAVNVIKTLNANGIGSTGSDGH